MAEINMALIRGDRIENIVVIEEGVEFAPEGYELTPATNNMNVGMVRGPDGEFASPVRPAEEVRAAAGSYLATLVRGTTDRILGPVPKQMRISLAGGLELVSDEGAAEKFLASAAQQLNALTVEDAE